MQLSPITKKTLLSAVFALSAASTVAAKPPPYYVEGNEGAASPNVQPLAPNTPSVALVGGGWDVAEAFRWMIKQGGMKPDVKGRFLVIRATGTNAYNPYIYSVLGSKDPTSPHENVGGKQLGVASAATMIVSSRAAADDIFTVEKIRNAHAIFVAGGNQADYQNNWAGSEMMKELEAAIKRGVPVGGTSAGAAILGEYAYVALGRAVYSQDVLLDPYDRDATINPLNTASKKNPAPKPIVSIPSLENMIVDQHVNTRDRLGRLLSFMSRTEKAVCAGGIENSSTVFGIGLSEETALLVSGTPGANVRAQIAVNPYDPATDAPGYTPRYSAYFLKYKGSPTTCAAGRPLEAKPVVEMYRMTAPENKTSPFPTTAPGYSFMTDAKFNLTNWDAQTPTMAGDGSTLVGPYMLGAGGGALVKPANLPQSLY
jgi:cyanophycinase